MRPRAPIAPWQAEGRTWVEGGMSAAPAFSARRWGEHQMRRAARRRPTHSVGQPPGLPPFEAREDGSAKFCANRNSGAGMRRRPRSSAMLLRKSKWFSIEQRPCAIERIAAVTAGSMFKAVEHFSL